MKKRILGILLASLMVISLLPVTVFATDLDSARWDITTNDQGGVTHVKFTFTTWDTASGTWHLYLWDIDDTSGTNGKPAIMAETTLGTSDDEHVMELDVGGDPEVHYVVGMALMDSLWSTNTTGGLLSRGFNLSGMCDTSFWPYIENGCDWICSEDGVVGDVYVNDTNSDISLREALGGDPGGELSSCDHEYDYWNAFDNGDGTHSYYCIWCNNEVKSSHDFDYWNASDNHDGTHSYCCWTCGAVSEEKEEHWYDYYGNYEDNGDGTHSPYCSSCYAFMDDVTEAHDFENGWYYDNGDGTHSAECSKCFAISTTKTAHSFTSYRNNYDGTHSAECEDCHATDSVRTPHDFTNGNCLCGAKKPNNSVSLTLDEQIGTNIILDLNTYMSNYNIWNSANLKVKLIYNHSNTAYATDIREETIAKNVFPSNGDGRYRYTVWQAPAQIAEAIKVEIYNNTNKIDEFTVNGKMYADHVLAGDYEAAHQAVAQAMVVYADEAAKYFGYAAASGQSDYAVITSGDGDTYNTTLTGIDMSDVEAFTCTGDPVRGITFMSLGKSALRVYYGIKSPITSASLTSAPNESWSVIVNADENYVEVSGIEGANLGESFTVTTNVGTFTASALSYAKAGYANSGLTAFCGALFNYAQAAAAYFG